MKKQTLVIILLAVLVVSCLALTACHECEFGEWTVKTAATCTQIGQEQRVCECGETEVRDIQTKGHTYGAWTTVKAATCTEDGIKLRYCTCGSTESKVITATGHSYKGVVTAPTCTKQGYTTHTCDCGDSYKDTYTNSVEHNYVDGICSYCSNYHPGSVGLIYNLSPDNTYFLVNLSSNCATDVVIPSVYHNKPVKVIRGTGDVSHIKSVTIPSSIISIENSAFRNCTSLKNVIFAEGSKLTSIEAQAFCGCTSLTSITIPESVTSIGSSAFQGCTSLKSIIISSNVTSIGKGAFNGCSTLESITLPFIGATLNDTEYTYIGYIFGASYYNQSGYVPSSLKTIVLTGCTKIGGSAFCGCTSLTSITIPESVTSIGWRAFGDCINLKDVYFAGTQAQWNNISIGSGNDVLTSATIHYNYKG